MGNKEPKKTKIRTELDIDDMDNMDPNINTPFNNEDEYELLDADADIETREPSGKDVCGKGQGFCPDVDKMNKCHERKIREGKSDERNLYKQF